MFYLDFATFPDSFFRKEIYFSNSACFLKTCKRDGCFVDLDNPSKDEPYTDVVCSNGGSVSALQVSLLDNAISRAVTGQLIVHGIYRFSK